MKIGYGAWAALFITVPSCCLLSKVNRINTYVLAIRYDKSFYNYIIKT